MAHTQEWLPNGLVLHQEDGFFKLGQDSMLLASFARPKRHARVLDLGCGTGVLALLLWRADLSITGLDLQAGALALFARSIVDNKLDNVQGRQGDLRHIRTLFRAGSMDYVVCNPPYFDAARGDSAQKDSLRHARQDVCCTLTELTQAIAFVLPTGGRAALVFRPERLLALLSALEDAGLCVKRMRFVHQSAHTPPSSVLLECRKGGSIEGLCVLPPLFILS